MEDPEVKEKTINEQLEILVKVQELDLEIDNATEHYESIPFEIQKLNDELQKIKLEIEEIKKNITEKQKNRKEKEIELGTVENQITKHKMELYQVKTNEQYKTLVHQLETEQELKSKLEDEILAILEDIDNATQQLKNKENEFSVQKNATEKKINELQQTMHELELFISNKKQEKQTYTSELSDYVLKRYEKTKKQKDGIGIAKIDEENECCSVCKMKLSKQTINEVASARSLVFCDNCSRILYL